VVRSVFVSHISYWPGPHSFLKELRFNCAVADSGVWLPRAGRLGVSQVADSDSGRLA
jgi:hypothetical protein